LFEMSQQVYLMAVSHQMPPEKSYYSKLLVLS
jgi:hypothetical protein